MFNAHWGQHRVVASPAVAGRLRAVLARSTRAIKPILLVAPEGSEERPQQRSVTQMVSQLSVMHPEDP